MNMRLNPFRKMSIKGRIIFTSAQLASFIIIYILSRTALSDVYLFEWTAHNHYLYIWIPVILLSMFNKTIISLFLTAGNLIGIILGQVLGDIIRRNNILKITDAMTEGEKYYLRSHKGAYIWMLTIIISLLTGVAAHIIYKKRVK